MSTELAIRGMICGGRPGIRKRIENALLIGIPTAGTLYALTAGYRLGITITTVVVFVVFYLWAGLGLSLGLHRYFTHRSFQCGRGMVIWLALGACFTWQGTILRWVADHRRHHRYHDHRGDVHSPVYTARGRRLTRLRGFLHAHFAWMFDDTTTDPAVYAPDLLRNRLILHFVTFYPLYASLSLVLPTAVGYVVGGATEGLRCLLWAGFVRITLIHHGTWAINSVCHSFGRQDFASGDQSRNVWFLSLLLFGEGLHNNHHAAPYSACLDFLPGQSDWGGWILRRFDRLGLVADLKTAALSELTPSPDKSQAGCNVGVE